MSTMNDSDLALIHRLERHLLTELSPETQKLAILAFHTVDEYLAHEDRRNSLRPDLERRLQRLFKYCQPKELPLIRGILGTRKVMYRNNHTLVFPNHLLPITLTPE